MFYYLSQLIHLGKELCSVQYRVILKIYSQIVFSVVRMNVINIVWNFFFFLNVFFFYDIKLTLNHEENL